MKKFTIVGLIAAAILAGAGLLFCGISALNGGYDAAKAVFDGDGISHGRWHINKDGIYFDEPDSWNDDDDDWDDDDWDDSEDLDDTENLDDTEDLDDTDAVSRVNTFPVSEIENLDMQIGAARIRIEEGDDSDNVVVTLKRGREKYYQAGMKDGTLEISYGKNLKGVNWGDNHAIITVQVPAGMKVDDIDMSIGACEAKILTDTISCNNLSVDVGAGTLETDGFTVAEEMELEIGAGEMILNGGTYGSADITCGVGNFEMKGSVAQDLTAECGMGNMEIHLIGNEEDYNYTLSCSMGNLKVGDTSYNAISEDKTIENDGAKGDIDLSCGMGNLELDFE